MVVYTTYFNINYKEERKMKNEIFWLVLTILLTSLIWEPYILDRIMEHKLIPALRNPNRDERPKSQWANRELVAGATQLLQDVLNKNPKTTVVVIEEISTDNWGINGQLVSSFVEK